MSIKGAQRKNRLNIANSIGSNIANKKRTWKKACALVAALLGIGTKVLERNEARVTGDERQAARMVARQIRSAALTERSHVANCSHRSHIVVMVLDAPRGDSNVVQRAVQCQISLKSKTKGKVIKLDQNKKKQ